VRRNRCKEKKLAEPSSTGTGTGVAGHIKWYESFYKTHSFPYVVFNYLVPDSSLSPFWCFLYLQELSLPYSSMTDTNKTAPVRSMAPADEHDHDHDHSDVESLKAAALFHKALRMGRVEEKGIQPIPVEERTVTRFYNIFTVWASINSNILG